MKTALAAALLIAAQAHAECSYTVTPTFQAVGNTLTLDVAYSLTGLFCGDPRNLGLVGTFSSGNESVSIIGNALFPSTTIHVQATLPLTGTARFFGREQVLVQLENTGGYGQYQNYDTQFYNIDVSTPVVTHMPEPETYAMMIAGLGLLGFIRGANARRAVNT